MKENRNSNSNSAEYQSRIFKIPQFHRSMSLMHAFIIHMKTIEGQTNVSQ